MFRTDAVVQITRQDTFFHDICLLSFHTFVVNIHGTTVERDCTVVNHIDVFVADFLIQLVGENGRVLAVEVGFKRMSDGFMQQDT